MDPTTLAHAKAHLAELVDAAERDGERTVILRDGVPVAAIVPISASERGIGAVADSDEALLASLHRFIAEIGACEPEVSAVDDLVAGRR